MDTIRFGRAARALRIHRGWRQADLARQAGVSQSLVSRVERGHADTMTVQTLEALLQRLGARLIVRFDWNGEAIDRLLDADHARLVESVVGRLQAQGWDAMPEVTFAIGGERGSIDVLGWHESTRTALVVEVKSVVPDVQAMLMALDRKTRLGAAIAREQSRQAQRIGRLLVIGESRTSRRRVEAHAATFAARFPDRIAAIRRFLSTPERHEPIRGLWFLSASSQPTTRHRVRGGRARPHT
jgi:transcriptional regulator with XRE-family HTH domain